MGGTGEREEGGVKKRPRKDEIASAAKLLRAEASKQLDYAVGDRQRAKKFSVERPSIADACLVTAAQHEARAARWTKVADWMISATFAPAPRDVEHSATPGTKPGTAEFPNAEKPQDMPG